MKKFNELNEQEKKDAMGLGYHGFFADRDNTQEAYDFAIELANTMKPADTAAMTTGIHVLLNTIALSVAQCKPSKSQLELFCSQLGLEKENAENQIQTFLGEK